jgi:hypothetical protein
MGWWIIATGDKYDDLAKDGRFNMVFYHPAAEHSGSKDSPGAIFHKSAE